VSIKDFENIEYFMNTSEAIVAVENESDKKVEGFVFCAKDGYDLEKKVRLDKDSVVEALHSDKLEIIEEIPDWWSSILSD